MEVEGILAETLGGISGGRDIAELFFIDVMVIGPIGGWINGSSISCTPKAKHSDEIIATNGILALDGAFFLNNIISFKMHSATSSTTEFIMT